MKISTTQLKKLIRQSIKEQVDYKDNLPGELVEHTTKVDDFINYIDKKAQELYDEGQELIKADMDILSSGEAEYSDLKIRNKFARSVGLLHRILRVLG